MTTALSGTRSERNASKSNKKERTSTMAITSGSLLVISAARSM